MRRPPDVGRVDSTRTDPRAPGGPNSPVGERQETGIPCARDGCWIGCETGSCPVRAGPAESCGTSAPTVGPASCIEGGEVTGPLSSSAWLRNFHPAPAAPVRLVCFPHAGGAATYYHPLSRALADEADVLAVQYPGRP